LFIVIVDRKYDNCNILLTSLPPLYWSVFIVSAILCKGHHLGLEFALGVLDENVIDLSGGFAVLF